jgi:hypothetical protein
MPGDGCDDSIRRFTGRPYRSDELKKEEWCALVNEVRAAAFSFDRSDELLAEYGLEALPDDESGRDGLKWNTPEEGGEVDVLLGDEARAVAVEVGIIQIKCSQERAYHRSGQEVKPFGGSGDGCDGQGEDILVGLRIRAARRGAPMLSSASRRGPSRAATIRGNDDRQ